MKSVPRTERSEELLQTLLLLPTNLELIENQIKQNNYTVEEISRAAYDYADESYYACLDYLYLHPEEYDRVEARTLLGILGERMPEIFALLLKYGLDPNLRCEDETVMMSVGKVYNGYAAADTVALLLDHGGDPEIYIGESLFSEIDFDIVFDPYAFDTLATYDSKIHVWLVLLSVLGEREEKLGHIEFFNPRGDNHEKAFTYSDLKNHRNYTFGLSNVPGRGESWSLHIFDKRTAWEVARV